jgi:hypothetical protein
LGKQDDGEYEHVIKKKIPVAAKKDIFVYDVVVTEFSLFSSGIWWMIVKGSSVTYRRIYKVLQTLGKIAKERCHLIPFGDLNLHAIQD